MPMPEIIRSSYIFPKWNKKRIPYVRSYVKSWTSGEMGEQKMILKIEMRCYKATNMLSELVGKRPAGNWEKLVRIQSRALTYLTGGDNEE